MKVRNTFAIFLVSGFWHGANWTFIIWGALNAIYFLPLLLTNNNRKNLGVVAEGKLLPSLRELFAMLTTFMLTVFAWIFFRAENISHAFSYIDVIFSTTILEIPKSNPTELVCLITGFLIIEWLGREEKYSLVVINKIKNPFLKIIILSVLFWVIIFFKNSNNQEFIYFQF